MRLVVFFMFSLYFSLVSSRGYAGYEFIVSDLKGRSTDFIEGTTKSATASLKSHLKVKFEGNEGTLDTGTTTISGGEMVVVSKQITFYFKAEMALWVVTVYPLLSKCFVVVHSDASEHGGARMLSLNGDCSFKKI